MYRHLICYWHMLLISALESWRQVDQKFKASQDNMNKTIMFPVA